MKKGKYRHFKGDVYNVLGLAGRATSKEEYVVTEDKSGKLVLWTPAEFSQTVTTDGKNQVKRFTHLSEGLKYMRFKGMIVNQHNEENHEYECPDCKASNWAYNGDPEDFTKGDIDAVRCWQCKKVFFVDERVASEYHQYDLESAEIIDGENKRKFL